MDTLCDLLRQAKQMSAMRSPWAPGLQPKSEPGRLVRNAHTNPDAFTENNKLLSSIQIQVTQYKYCNKDSTDIYQALWLVIWAVLTKNNYIINAWCKINCNLRKSWKNPLSYMSDMKVSLIFCCCSTESKIKDHFNPVKIGKLWNARWNLFKLQ